MQETSNQNLIYAIIKIKRTTKFLYSFENKISL